MKTTTTSPLGMIDLYANGGALTGVYLATQSSRPDDDGDDDPGSADVLARAVRQLAEYFAGSRRAFDLPLATVGTDFQKTVWRGLLEIPWGETRSYAALASAVKNPRAVRAVGSANSKNPISIIIPCHRVVGADGSLRGYAGGERAKQWLLSHEMQDSRVKAQLPLTFAKETRAS